MARVPNSVPLYGAYLKAGYYLRVIPFRLKYDLDDRKWILVCTKIHWISCILLTWMPRIVFSTLGILNESVEFSKLSKKSATSYFRIGFSYLNMLRVLCVLWVFTRRQKNMESVINSCYNILTINNDVWRQVQKCVEPEDINQSNAKITSTAINRAQIYFFFIAMVYFGWELAVVFGSYAGVADWPTSLLQHRILTVRKRLFLAVPDNLKEVEFSTENITLGILHILMHLASEVVNFFAEIALMAPYPLALWLAARQFEMFLHHAGGERENGRSRPVEVMVADIEGRYEQLKDLSNSLNACWGKTNFMWHLATFLRTIFLLEGFNKTAWNQSRNLWLLLPLFQMICQIVALIFSADVFVKLSAFIVTIFVVVMDKE